MKCNECGFENKDTAKFCSNCGSTLSQKPSEVIQTKSDNSKYVIIALVVVIILLVAVIGFFAISGDANSVQSNDDSQGAVSQDNLSQEDDSGQTKEISSSKTTEVVEEKSWESIGSYSGSGSGSQTISVPEGKIMVKLSAYPIKNYATNYLYVSGSNGEFGGVDWGSKSAVETRSDSFTYTSGSEETFTIDYYETVSWEVEFFRYQ